jgi:hypothetical protein
MAAGPRLGPFQAAFFNHYPAAITTWFQSPAGLAKVRRPKPAGREVGRVRQNVKHWHWVDAGKDIAKA